MNRKLDQVAGGQFRSLVPRSLHPTIYVRQKRKMTMDLHSECPETGNTFREAMLAEVKTLVRTEQRKADRRRKQYFKPDFSSIAAYGLFFRPTAKVRFPLLCHNTAAAGRQSYALAFLVLPTTTT